MLTEKIYMKVFIEKILNIFISQNVVERITYLNIEKVHQ